MLQKNLWKVLNLASCKAVEGSTTDEESAYDNECATKGDNKIKLDFQSFLQLKFCRSKVKIRNLRKRKLLENFAKS